VADLNLVQQLRDLHLPPAPGMWPLAWGWWLMIACCIIFLALSPRLYAIWQLRQGKLRFLQQLKTIEDAYQANPNQPLLLTEFAYLLKRVALSYFPRQEVASLHGEAWVMFLRSTSKQALPDKMTSLLTDHLYQAECKEDLGPYFVFARHWIKQQRKRCTN
jgi:hypothetical protein